MITALCGLTAATVGALLLFPGYGHVGIAAAIALSGWVGASALAVVLWRRGWLEIDRAAQRRLPRIVLATVVMAAAIKAGNHLMGSVFDMSGSALARIVTLVVLVVAGLGVYLAAIQILGIARFDELRAELRRRF
jgi:putative peptidoglycan lipid II flippase